MGHPKTLHFDGAHPLQTTTLVWLHRPQSLCVQLVSGSHATTLRSHSHILSLHVITIAPRRKHRCPIRTTSTRTHAHTHFPRCQHSCPHPSHTAIFYLLFEHYMLSCRVKHISGKLCILYSNWPRCCFHTTRVFLNSPLAIHRFTVLILTTRTNLFNSVANLFTFLNFATVATEFGGKIFFFPQSVLAFNF